MDILIRISFIFNFILIISSQEVQDLKKSKSAYDINEQMKNYAIFNSHISIKMKDEPLHHRLKKFNENFPDDSIFENATKCIRDIKYIATNLKSSWALKMLDAFGKPESGIMVGNSKILGEYTECMQVYGPKMNLTSNKTTGDFHGQYCTLSIMQVVTVGICIPDSCTSEIQNIFELLNPVDETSFPSNTTAILQSDCKPRKRHLNGPSKAVIALLSLFSAVVILASSITVMKYFLTIITTRSQKNSLTINIPPNDLGGDSSDRHKINLENKDDDLLLHDRPSTSKVQAFFEKIEPFSECFCLFKNGAKLLNTDSSEGELLCIHGIRFLSMSWVILGHAYVFVFAETRNPLETIDTIKGFPFQIILQGFYSVDSFFVLSGFLLTYLCMQQLAKSQGSMNWLYFYIHRYLRLTPMYMIILGFSASLYFYLGSGPFWPSNDLDNNCSKYWWYNLLYINNFLSLTNQQCMGWSWYLANDMQFFIISPAILVLLWRWPKVGCSVIALLLGGCWVANFYLTYHYNLLPGLSGILSVVNYANTLEMMSRMLDYMDKLYIKPYTRISPYLVGMLLGYLLYVRKRNNSSKHSLVFLSVGWIIATTCTLATVYGLYHQNPTLVANSFYNALSRTVWGLGLSWVIYVCLVDQAGFINEILSFKLFIPLSRLTYAAYLIHPLIINGYYGSLKTTFEFSHPTVVIIFLGLMVLTYGMALPVALVLESPIIKLEKLVRKTFANQQE